MKKLISVVFILLFFVSLSVKADILDSINKITMHAYGSKGYVKIFLYYENTDSGKDIIWWKKRVEYTCVLYQNDGTDIEPEEGTQITRQDGVISASYQQIYIKIPSWHLGDDEKGIVKCEFDIGWPHLKAESSVNLK